MLTSGSPNLRSDSFSSDGKESMSVQDTGCLSIVVLGALGDLKKKKTFPAFYNLYRQGFIQSSEVHIFRYARTRISDDELGNYIPGSLPRHVFNYLRIYNFKVIEVATKLEVFPGSEFCVAYKETVKYGGKVILGDRQFKLDYREMNIQYLYVTYDQPRTLPGHPWLDTLEGHASLRRVLVRYSFGDSHVGYYQGLNYVATMFLLVMKSKDDKFWMLAILLENVLVNDCYTPNLLRCHVEQRVFQDMLVKKCPRELLGQEFCSIQHITTEVRAAVVRESANEELTEGSDIGTKELMHMSEEETMEYVARNISYYGKNDLSQYPAFDLDILMHNLSLKVVCLSMVNTYSQRTQHAADGRFHIKVAELCERYFCHLPYDAVLLEWPLNLVGLVDKGDRKLLGKQRERSISVRRLGKVEDYCSLSTAWFDMHSKPSIPTSKFVVSYSSEETSSSGRGDECSVMEETINSVDIRIEGGKPSKIEETTKYNTRRSGRPGWQSTAVTGVAAIVQEIVKAISSNAKEKLEVSVVATAEVEKSSLKRKRHDKEGEEEAKAAAKLVEKHSDLVKHDDVMSKSVEALKVEQDHFVQSNYDFGLSPSDVVLGQVRRFMEIVFPSEALEDVMADAGISPKKTLELPPESTEPV
ncbi:hypothetical protein GIB67_025599 [Kingdonia uniflora]|uniref:Rab-GAP TBC domain-containing protein n=1 Tax=Kingdonia uniflora TaxID=39325 RepID=A0A7J7M0Q1_9MAGN|nr:hypothetical protein GIB67_025599 [Kingdonia uniflora]